MEEKPHAKSKSNDRLDHESKMKKSYYWRGPQPYQQYSDNLKEIQEWLDREGKVGLDLNDKTGLELRDTFADIPYVDDTSWPVKVDEHLGVIHLRPDKLKFRKGPYTFSFRGKRYLMVPVKSRNKDNKWTETFSISSID